MSASSAAIVADDHLRLAALDYQAIELSRQPPSVPKTLTTDTA